MCRASRPQRYPRHLAFHETRPGQAQARAGQAVASDSNPTARLPLRLGGWFSRTAIPGCAAQAARSGIRDTWPFTKRARDKPRLGPGKPIASDSNPTGAPPVAPRRLVQPHSQEWLCRASRPQRHPRHLAFHETRPGQAQARAGQADSERLESHGRASRCASAAGSAAQPGMAVLPSTSAANSKGKEESREREQEQNREADLLRGLFRVFAIGRAAAEKQVRENTNQQDAAKLHLQLESPGVQHECAKRRDQERSARSNLTSVQYHRALFLTKPERRKALLRRMVHP